MAVLEGAGDLDHVAAALTGVYIPTRSFPNARRSPGDSCVASLSRRSRSPGRRRHPDSRRRGADPQGVRSASRSHTASKTACGRASTGEERDGCRRKQASRLLIRIPPVRSAAAGQTTIAARTCPGLGRLALMIPLKPLTPSSRSRIECAVGPHANWALELDPLARQVRLRGDEFRTACPDLAGEITRDHPELVITSMP